MSDYDVLFVDDDTNLLKAIKRNLIDRFKVLTAETVDEARKALEKYNFAVICSDMKMPQMNGADFLSLTKKSHPDSIRILLTGETDVHEAIKAFNESDIYKLLIKPCSQKSLLDTLDSAMKLFHAHKLEDKILDTSLKGFINVVLEQLALISPEVFKRSIDIKKIVNSPKTSFPVKDSRAFEISCLLMYFGSIHYKIYKFDQIYSTPNMVKVIRKSASFLTDLPGFESVYEILNELADFYSSEAAIEELDSDSKTLKLLIDYHSMLRDTSANKKLRMLYSKEIIAQLPGFFGKISSLDNIHNIKVSELEEGMTAAEDITVKSGSILVFKGEKVSGKIIETINLFAEKEMLNEPLKIKVQSGE